MIEPAAANPFGTVLTGGRIIDERNGIDGVFDLAISNGRIAAAKSWKRRPSNSEKGSSVVARPPMRRKT